MAAITSAMVKELRERTSAGMMDCKKALVESDGDTSLPRPITSSASPTRLPSRLPWPTPLMWTP